MDIAENQSLVRLRRGEELTAGELCRMILALSIPAIVAQISTIIMQYIDAAMVGRLGAGGSAAIGLVSSTTRAWASPFSARSGSAREMRRTPATL